MLAGSGSDWGSFTGWGEVWVHGVVWIILAVLPDFCVEKAVEEVVAGDAVEAAAVRAAWGLGSWVTRRPVRMRKARYRARM